MSEWWTYNLSDFLMFSPEIYWRLVERYNRDVWPLQLLALAAAAFLLWLALAQHAHGHAQRATALVLAAAWFWTGWAFDWQRYASINWAAEYLAVACGVQAALLLAVALLGPRRESAHAGLLARRIGFAAAVCGVLLYPLVGLLFGRPIAQAEVFALMPDPTALTTLGLLFASNMRWRGWLAIIPALSLLAGLLTLWTMAQ
jgi:hypothetical protein